MFYIGLFLITVGYSLGLITMIKTDIKPIVISAFFIAILAAAIGAEFIEKGLVNL